MKAHKLRRKKFNNIGPWLRIYIGVGDGLHSKANPDVDRNYLGRPSCDESM